MLIWFPLSHSSRFSVPSPSSPLLASHANCLPVGTRVSDFEIVGLIGEGGFGIVYLAKDTSLDRIVALKEFMPSSFAGRIDGIQVAVRSANNRATFDAGLKSFINEAKMLARFAHPALVEVFRFWEGNGTAYMAMRMYRGETLRQVLTRGGDPFNEERIAQIMGPIFDALEMLHREQVFHRDIAPDNIMLTDARSVLLDFGSARRIIGDGTQALTTVLKPGYAPIEQYSDDGTMKQGAWTDVYALGGVLYHLATGKTPMQAVSRMISDPMQSVSDMTGERFSPNFSQAVAKAMSVHVENRFQTVTEFRQALGWNVVQAQVVTLPPPQVWLEPKPSENADEKTGQRTGDKGGQPAAGNMAAAVAPAGTAAIAATAGATALADPIIKGERSMPPRVVASSSRMPMMAGVAVAVIAAIAAAIFFSRGGGIPPVAPAQGQAPPTATLPTTLPSPPPGKTTPDQPTTATAPAAAATPAAPVGEGWVRFDITPRGRIDIDGITKGLSTAVKEVKLPVGMHTIEISNGQAAPLKRTIEVKRDETITISHTF